jgi:arylsulfatase A-like enzyme
MRPQRFRAFLALAAFCATIVAGSCSAAEAQATPNIVFLLVDDLRADAVAALGSPIAKTPNLDRIVRSGTVFRQAYCLGSNSPAVCLPSRNMLLSGRAYFRWMGPQAPADRPNLPGTMREAGYVTFHCGKRGNVAQEIEKRFDETHYLDDQKERTSGQPGRRVVDEAIDFLERRPADRPFFLYLAFEAPHDPRVADEEFRRFYTPAEIPLPANYLPLHPFDNGEMTVRDERLAPWPRSEAEIRRHLHDYYSVITGLDHHIGRLLARLDSMGLADDTILVFSSDHGLAVGSHGLMGKQSLYEHSMKVPLVIAGPGIPRGEIDALVYLLDLFPTIVQLAGVQLPEGLDGKSLVPLIQNESSAVRDSLFLAYRDVQRAVRAGEWKLIRYPKVDKTQLFNLKEDPGELIDRSGEAEQQSRVAEMTALLRSWQSELGDSAPLEVPDPKASEFVPPLEQGQ